jgi:hypothetical protein
MLALMLCPVIVGCQCVLPCKSPVPVASADESETRGLIRALGLPLGSQRSAHFVVIASDVAWGESVSRKLETFYADFFARIKADGFDVRQPNGPRLVWVAFDSRADFDRYVAMSECASLPWLDGFYSGRTNRVAVIRKGEGEPDRGAGESTRAEFSADANVQVAGLAAGGVNRGDLTVPVRHEAAHQLSFNCGLLARGVTYPLWVSEGLATNFESGSPTDDGSNKARRDCVRECLRSHQAVSLDELIGATRVQGSPARCRSTYAFAWAFFRFAYQRHREELKRYLAGLAETETIITIKTRPQSPAQCPDRAQWLRAQFELAFGPLDHIEPEWSQFLRGI